MKLCAYDFVQQRFVKRYMLLTTDVQIIYAIIEVLLASELVSKAFDLL